MDKLDHLGWVVSQVYRLGEERIEVRTTSPSFAGWVDHVLGAYRVDQDFEDNPYFSVVVEDHAPSVAGGKRFHILYRRTAAVVRSLDLRTIAQAFLTEIERIKMPFREDALMLDAAVAMVADVPVLFPGYLVPVVSAMGRRASREGIRLPAHSTVQVDAHGYVVPTESALVVPGDALEQLRWPTDGEGSDGHVSISEPIRPRAILQLAHEQGVALREASKGLVLHRLGTQAMNLSILGGQALGSLGTLVSRARVYETTWSSERAFLDVLPQAVGISPTTYADDRREDTPEGR
jgi:hypothetical protein